MSGSFFGGKKPDPKEQVKEWKASLRKELRGLDRQVLNIEREEMKIKLSVREAAKKNQIDVCKVLAKSLVQSRKAKNRIHTSKAQINSVMMNMQNQQSMSKVAGAMQKSSEVMKSMMALVRLPEMAETMRELAQEMTKAGLMEEIMDDTFEGMEDEDLEEEAEAEVSEVLFELTKGQLGAAPAAVAGSLKQEEPPSAETDQEADAMIARLEALRS